MTHDQKEDLWFSDAQIDQVNWTDDEDEEPEGGQEIGHGGLRQARFH